MIVKEGVSVVGEGLPQKTALLRRSLLGLRQARDGISLPSPIPRGTEYSAGHRGTK